MTYFHADSAGARAQAPRASQATEPGQIPGTPRRISQTHCSAASDSVLSHLHEAGETVQVSRLAVSGSASGQALSEPADELACLSLQDLDVDTPSVSLTPALVPVYQAHGAEIEARLSDIRTSLDQGCFNARWQTMDDAAREQVMERIACALYAVSACIHRSHPQIDAISDLFQEPGDFCTVVGGYIWGHQSCEPIDLDVGVRCAAYPKSVEYDDRSTYSSDRVAKEGIKFLAMSRIDADVLGRSVFLWGERDDDGDAWDLGAYDADILIEGGFLNRAGVPTINYKGDAAELADKEMRAMVENLAVVRHLVALRLDERSGAAQSPTGYKTGKRLLKYCDKQLSVANQSLLKTSAWKNLLKSADPVKNLLREGNAWLTE